MSPGIVDAQDTITEGDTVVIVDEQHHKPLAIGTALITGPEMVENNKGKDDLQREVYSVYKL